MKFAFNSIVLLVSLVIYSFIAGFIFILAIEILEWLFAHLMGANLLGFLEKHRDWQSFSTLFADYRMLAVITGTGLIVYLYYKFSGKE